ncbi:MAG: nucleotidyltransferase family protein [Clostridia bacterium]|nr:nucleotidyltransferase family protein [Clostridia bacterium]
MISGIIAEFDPFHNGHEYVIKRAKELSDAVIVCLSGNLTQRGEPSFISKSKRAECAIKAGADLVIELPSYFSSQSAEGFARAGVSLLYAAGANNLVFGSECADKELLERAASLTESLLAQIREAQREGVGFAAARERVFCENGFEKEAAIVSRGNDILACEYIKAIKKQKISMTFSPVLREHGRETVSEGFAPASFIRKGKTGAFAPYMPSYSHEILKEETENGFIARRERAEREILYALRIASVSELSEIAEINEGLEFAIKKAAEKATSLSELFSLVATKRYTNGRLSRAVLNAVLLKKRSNKDEKPPYIRVLAIGERGRELLRNINEGDLPVIVRSSDGNNLSSLAKKVFDYEVKSYEFRSLCCERYTEYGGEYRITPYTEKNKSGK